MGMKRTYNPTGSAPYSAAKRLRKQRVVVAAVPRSRFRARSSAMNGTSLFQPNVSSPEKKNVDFFTSAFWTSASGNWTITPINLIAQGTTATTHIGRKAVMTSVLVRGWFTTASNATPPRIVLVYDKETNGATPGATDVFASNDSMAPMNLANSDRFIVVADHSPVLANGMLNCTNPTMMNFEIYRKMRLPLQFNDTTTATITAINTGGLFLCCALGDAATTLTTQETYTRVRFIDN